MARDASCYTWAIDFDSLPPLVRALPPAPDPDALLGGFVDYTLEQGIELYPAQEEAILELLAGNHVILNTPTGSGKSLVAAAAHYAALADDKVSVYTAPIKALVSEKFFALCRDFGTDRVGMITGDASVNPDAPIICCTAEILANWALREGAETPVDTVIVDEFHYYSDPQRGWAWQLPLLELPHTQFLLMSATLGDTDWLARDLERRSGREVALVTSAQRPVPLDFEYRRCTLHASITELLERNLAPIYLVHFTQRDATEAAQGYLSLDPLSANTDDGGKANKARIREAIGGFRFDSPIGKDLRRYLMGGIGVHHAGLLPKYRLLVEKLAQEGLLKIICGTDTLGVGVNVPIRSVLFTQLFKYDGVSTRTLDVREFQQIAGRAGRKGYDDRGTVWVQAPEHVVENLRAEEKASKKQNSKKVVKKKQPDSHYAHWTEDTFTKLVTGQPSPMRSSFDVTHQMVMSLLDRPRGADGLDGCDAVRHLMTHNHEPRRRKRVHIRRAVSIYRSLVEAELLEFPDEPDEWGRKVRVNFDLQDDFALHQPLSLWALTAIEERLAEQDAGETEDDLPLALDLVTIIESILENPGVIIAAQVNLAKSEAMAQMKAAGIEYEERMERLAEIQPPRPNADWLYESFDRWRVHHPWVGSDNVRPKSVVRDLYEQAMTFSEFVQHYGLKRSEGVVLRYLSDVYKALRQNVPEAARTDDLGDLTEWLGVLVRQVDSSLIDEWEAMTAPVVAGEEAAEVRPPVADDITLNRRAFRTMVRNRLFRWVENLALKRNYAELADTNGSSVEDILKSMAPYWETYDSIGIDGDARSSARFVFDPATGAVTQILADPDGHDEWRITATVDLDASREEGRAVVVLDAIAGVPAE